MGNENTLIGSVITLDMIKLFAAFHETSLEDGTQFPGIIGTLTGWEAGQGELNANLVDAPSLRDTFAPLREAYFAAKDMEAPEYSVVEDPSFLQKTAE